MGMARTVECLNFSPLSTEISNLKIRKIKKNIKTTKLSQIIKNVEFKDIV